MAFQKFNKRIQAWQVHNEDGTIRNVKEKEPRKRFKGVPVRRQKK